MTNYWGNVLEAFSGGALTDIRFRVAFELMKAHAPHLTRHVPEGAAIGESRVEQQTPDEFAAYWLDAAARLVEWSEDREYIRALPEDDSLSKPLRDHLRRTVRANVYQQSQAATITAEESGPQLTRASTVPPAPNGRQ